MVKIYSKVDPSILLISIFRKSDISSERTDISPDNEYLQVATKKLPIGKTFAPHRHNYLERTTTITQEAWVFMSGKVKAEFWDLDDVKIYETDFGAGDIAVVYRGGHSFEVLEDDTILYEFKTGPYFGQSADKTFITRRKNEN